MDLSNIGVSTVKDSTAFKKIQFFSKIDPTSIFNIKSDFQQSFNKVSSLYTNDLTLNTSYSYGMDRQHNYTSLNSTLPMFNTLLDKSSVNKFFGYNFNNLTQDKTSNNLLSMGRLSYQTNGDGSNLNESSIYECYKLFPQKFSRFSELDFVSFLKYPNLFSIISAENDSKQFSNPFKLALNLRHKKKVT
jgi:hypothetical protein